MDVKEYIVGPLGIWRFPVLNFIISLIVEVVSREVGSSHSTPTENVEEWVWTDYKGRERRIRVKRVVH